MFFFASLYVQEILGYSPLKAGLAFLPVTAGIGSAPGIAQQLIKRIGVAHGRRRSACHSPPLGMFLLRALPVDGTYVGDVLPGLLTACRSGWASRSCR